MLAPTCKNYSLILMFLYYTVCSLPREFPFFLIELLVECFGRRLKNVKISSLVCFHFSQMWLDLDFEYPKIVC